MHKRNDNNAIFKYYVFVDLIITSFHANNHLHISQNEYIRYRWIKMLHSKKSQVIHGYKLCVVNFQLDVVGRSEVEWLFLVYIS